MKEPPDPVLAAVEQARQRPPLPESKRARLIALDAEATGETRTWESLVDEVAALAPAETAKPIRPWDIFLAAGWRWGGPQGAGENSDPICDVQQLVGDAREATMTPGPFVWSPVVRLGFRAATAFLDHPRIVDWIRMAEKGLGRDPIGQGFTLAGLHFEVDGREDDVVLLNSGVEVGRIHGALQ